MLICLTAFHFIEWVRSELYMHLNHKSVSFFFIFVGISKWSTTFVLFHQLLQFAHKNMLQNCKICMHEMKLFNIYLSTPMNIVRCVIFIFHIPLVDKFCSKLIFFSSYGRWNMIQAFLLPQLNQTKRVANILFNIFFSKFSKSWNSNM